MFEMTVSNLSGLLWFGCHSEQSDESLKFYRTQFDLFLYKIQSTTITTI